MPADGGLRELHDVAQFGDRQFAPFEDCEHADANRVGENGELIDNRRSFHPYSRMEA